MLFIFQIASHKCRSIVPGTYDFFYVPIDFGNKCNLGYAFINFTDPRSIVALAQVVA